MSSVEERLNKLREERTAREKARIQKLRELNLRKYDHTEQPKNVQNKINTSSIKTANKNIDIQNHSRLQSAHKQIVTSAASGGEQNSTNKNVPIKTSSSAKTVNTLQRIPETATIKNKSKSSENFIEANKRKVHEVSKNNINIARKSVAPQNDKPSSSKLGNRKSMIPERVEKSQPNKNRESVFDRLYKPKAPREKVETDDMKKMHKIDFKQHMKNISLITNKRHTVFEAKSSKQMPVRRSISAVHFKRVNKNELSRCFHKWNSVSEKIDEAHLHDEDEHVMQDKIVSAIKSERKKVKFQTPSVSNFNTPRPEELQSKLKNWLQKRGKSFDSYHHLQCFGLNHLAHKEFKSTEKPARKLELYDEENKENIAVESDSDNDSYLDNMNNKNDDLCNGNKVDKGLNKWRRASYVSDSVELNETETTLDSEETNMHHHIDDLLLGALNDLTDLLKEGFEWEQSARWLRAIREQYPHATNTAAYWECRAQLEERRGDLPASVRCWEEAVAKGTECSVVDANLDQLLTKFMQLKLSPKGRTPDSKLHDVKNVFKSTVIRFAVQQAKLRQCNSPGKFTITPVRRSSRLSVYSNSSRTPLRVCATLQHAASLAERADFVNNEHLAQTP